MGSNGKWFGYLNILNDSEEKLTSTDGVPFPGMEVKVVDSNGETCPANEEGDLLCKGPALFVGYLKHIEVPLQSIGWLVYHRRSRVMDEDGYIRITGRNKDIIIRGGENIPVAYIENVSMNIQIFQCANYCDA